MLTGIIFALKTGVAWKNLPATSDFPSGHTCRRRLLEWHARGVWRRLWQDLLSELQAEGRLSSSKVMRDYAHGVPQRLRDAVDSLEEGKRLISATPTLHQVARGA